MTREEAEAIVPKTYEDAMRNAAYTDFIHIMSLWGKLIDIGYVQDFDEVVSYEKKLYEQGLRKRLIDILVEG